MSNVITPGGLTVSLQRLLAFRPILTNGLALAVDFVILYKLIPN